MLSAMLSFWLLVLLDNSTARDDPVPHKESEQWTSYSVALHILLPVAGFCILWGRRDLLTRLMLQIDRNCISVFCPSLSKREKLLKWATENLPNTWSSPSKTLSGGIPDLWKDGSLLCTLINMAVPGACPNPPKHWKKPPTHAQALAYKYLGITPVFTDNDFEGVFSPSQEKKFLHYLQEIQQAMKDHNIGNENLNFSSAYLTKGMGLQTGEQYRKAIFYVYSNTTNSNYNNILVYIKGPYGSQGTATVPAFHNLNSISVLNYLNKQVRASDKIVYKKAARKSFLEAIALDFTSFVNLEKKVLTNDVPIHVEMEKDRVKITYIPHNYGIYEINLITNGEILKGSPFSANVIENMTGIRDSFENSDEILKELPAIRKKRIVSRYIDCINEKIQLQAMEDDIREKSLIGNVTSVSVITNNQADSQKSEVSIDNLSESLPVAVIQYETQPNVLDNKIYQSESFQKLEKIHEDQDESEMDYFPNENFQTSKHGNHLDIKSETSITSSPGDFKLIPVVNVTAPEEIIENYLEGVENVYQHVNKYRTDAPVVNRKNDNSLPIQLEENKLENQIDVIASIKPFIQYTDNQRTLVENQHPTSLGAEDMIGDGNRDYIKEIREMYENPSNSLFSEYIRSEDVISRINFDKNRDDRVSSSEGLNQNRPTSIVSPFLKTTTLTSVENNDTFSEPEKREQNSLFPDVHSHIDELDHEACHVEASSVLTTDQSIAIYHQSSLIEEATNYFLEYNENNRTYNRKSSATNLESSDINKSESTEFLPDNGQSNDLIGNNYVESLKTILMTKMNSQSNNTKTFKDLANMRNKLKNMTNHNLQDENNNESFPVASPICPDHIAQEVESSMSQSFGNLSLSERRKFFTRQQCTSIPSSNNSSFSEGENEDVCEKLDGHKYSLRVLSVMDAIKKSTNGNVLNRNTSTSVPNISQSKPVTSDYSSLNMKTSADFRSSFLKTREYWKRISSENCLTSSSHHSLYQGQPVMNTEVRNLKHSSLYSPDIHRSVDDILSISRTFKPNRLRRYSSLNQKDLEAIEFISIEERKKKLLQDNYEQECLGSRFIKKHVSPTNNYHQSKIENSQDVTKTKCERPSKLGVSRNALSLSNLQHLNSNSISQTKELTEEPMVRRETKSCSQFKRAITFFKNLETSSLCKKKSMEQKRFHPVARRRSSLDFQKQHNNAPKIGGSLRITKTLEKFAVTQIYFDIMSNRRGSFKGSPNRKALSETLASLTTNDHLTPSENKKSEDGIKYNMFLNKLKTKKRRSIKSVFDIHY